MSKRHVTNNEGQPLTTSDGSYVVIEAEIDPRDLRLFTRRQSRSKPGFTGPYRN